MKCEVITSDEVKITLSGQELEAEGISFDDKELSREKKGSWLRKLLKKAEELTGKQGSDCMSVKCFPRKNGGCALYVSGWKAPWQRGVPYLFDSLDDWLRFYHLLRKEDKEAWKEGTALSSGRFVILRDTCGDGGEFCCEFAAPLTGEYLSCYLSEHRDEL